MSTRKLLCIVVAAAAVSLTSAPPLRAFEWADSDRGQQKVDREQELYDGGTDAIDEHDWQTAAKKFAAVAEMKMSHADAALFWLAYARNKMGMRSEALSTLVQLKSDYPKSKWTGDAEKLEVEIRQSAGQRIEPDRVSDDELKLIALNGLMQSDPERAIPLLEGLLQPGKPAKLKDRALFILSQSQSQQAYDILSHVARNGADPDLQRRAIRYIGIMAKGERNRALLADIYASTPDVEVKKSVLRAYMLSGDREKLLALAKGEPNDELREDAVRQLGLTGGREELADLYRAEKSVEVRKRIIQAMFLSGNAEKLYDIAKSEPNRELKLTAIRNIGLLGERSGPFLGSLYNSDSDEEVRKTVITSLFISNNARALVDLARRETNPELKKDIITKLGLMHSKEAADYLMEYLKN